MPYWIFISATIISCSGSDKGSDPLNSFQQYFALASNDSDDKWNYTADTVRVWFDEKEGDPVLRIKGQGSTGPWKEWDEEMHANSSYDSIWFDKDQHAIVSSTACWRPTRA